MAHASIHFARQMSEMAPAPPPAPSVPPAFRTPVDWTLLIGIVGGLYVLVMVAAAGFFFAMKRRSPAGQAGLEEGNANAPPTVQATPVASPDNIQLVRTNSMMSRTVKRQGSAWRRGATPSVDLSSIEREIKFGFIRKVYCILSTQLLMTVVIIVGGIYRSFETTAGEAGPDPTKPTEFGIALMSSWWIGLATIIPLVMIICCLHSMKNSYPHNYILLFLFTAIESCVLTYVCVIYYSAGYGDQILLAAALTTVIFLSLTVFTMQSKVDWSFLGPFLMCALMLLIFWSFFTMIFVPFLYFEARKFTSLFGALIFCGFIIYDTNEIMKHMGVDDYIIAAIELYLDIINLFLYLLQFLSSMSSN